MIRNTVRVASWVVVAMMAQTVMGADWPQWLAKEDRLFRTNLFAHPAVNAAQHINIKGTWLLLYIGVNILPRKEPRRNPYGTRRTNELTKLARNTLFPPRFVPD